MAGKKKLDDAAQAVTSIKGFNSDLQCRGFQFEFGKTYEVKGKIKACENGFHACPIEEHPLAVFDFYPPAGSRYGEVLQFGETDREDTKLASAKLTVGVEISLGALAERAVKWVFDRADWKNAEKVTGDNEGATASGTRGAATASGYAGIARGANGCALFLVERDDNYNIINVWAGIVGRDVIKSDTFYRLEGGKPVEVAA
ncbi:MAG: hypothetical protein J0G95_10985 [Rhizobiales bacterium]|nr:hypothetical protein [Hyphomicrobiales bacterium]